MRRSYLTVAIIVAAVGSWLGSGLFANDEAAPPPAVEAATGSKPFPVRVRESVAREHVRTLRLFGHTEAERQVDIRVETAGRVVEKAVQKGAIVKAGDVVARLAMDDRKARLAEAEAAVEHRRLAYKAARDLSSKAFRSKVQLAESRAGLEAARAALAAIRLDLERTVVRAPFDGVADTVAIEVGDYLEVGDVVAGIVDLDPILAVAEVSERNIHGLAVGAEARARQVNGAEEVAGTVRYLSRVGTDATRTFRIEVALANPGHVVPEGVTLALAVDLEKVRAHLVSPAVLTLSDDGALGVKVVDEKARVLFRPVHVAGDAPDGMWLAGLPERLRIITVGQEFVRAGQDVTPVDDAAEGKPGT